MRDAGLRLDRAGVSSEPASRRHREIPRQRWRGEADIASSRAKTGAGKTLLWGVPDGTRGGDGQLVHDDHVMADALVAKLDELEWSVRTPTRIVRAKDPLEEMSRFGGRR